MSLHLFSRCGSASAPRHLSSSSLPPLLNSNGNPFTKSIIHSTPNFSFFSRIMREEKASFLSVSRNNLKSYHGLPGVNSFDGNSSFSSSSSGGAESNGKELESVNEDDDEEEEEEEDIDEEEEILPDRWEVVGLGQAMVDFSGMVDNEFLEKLEIEKGTRKLINHEERGRVLQAMDGCSYKAAAGGSLSNTLVALARLGGRSIGGPGLNVAMTGSIGSDPLGGFYR
ncbi:hypothetical protein C5167_032435 [Papaver somniferum]|uniref:Carbohydrate kinase PfkB domain-containing protein n=2 Tax=Papaver somniferum TaxID=3469 RepID=A0A4Y7K972_PAPSO|nr:hypothetical protein C5167_032435 [Papaver somniferum]